MRPNLGWIRKFHHSEHALGTRPLLLVFPHAGSGASGYREFSRVLNRDVDVVVFQYPGRQDRVREPMPSTLRDMAEGAFAEFQTSPLAGVRPLLLFGHSMGARIAFEFARLVEAGGSPADLLCVSATAPPCRQHLFPPEPTDDEGILGRLSLLNGTAGDVLESQELLRLALPAMRADYEVFNRGNADPQARTAAPLLILGGQQDPAVSEEILGAWAQHASGRCETRLFPGAHFYWQSQIDTVAQAVVEVFRAVSERSAEQASR